MTVNNELQALGNALKRVRDDQKISPEQLASRANISVPRLHAIEKGEVETSLTELARLAKGLETTVERLCSAAGL